MYVCAFSETNLKQKQTNKQTHVSHMYAVNVCIALCVLVVISLGVV